MRKKAHSHLLGFSTESDGHRRITRGDNFTVVGGTKESHEKLQEKAIKFNECLDKRGKQMHECSRKELADIAGEAGLDKT